MAFSKAYKFSTEIYFLSLLGKVLSHPARIRIIQLLGKHKVASFDKLKTNIPIESSTFSNHIKYLKRMNIVKYEANQKYEGYTLNNDLPVTIKQMIKIIQNVEKNQVEDMGAEMYYVESSEGQFKNNMIKEPREIEKFVV